MTPMLATVVPGLWLDRSAFGRRCTAVSEATVLGGDCHRGFHRAEYYFLVRVVE
jgi:hypothetical protein